MRYVHLFLKYAFATIAGLLFGGILLAAGLCIAYVLSFVAPIVGLACLYGGIVGLSFGFKLGSAWGYHFYQDYLEPAAANPLLVKLDHLNTSPSVTLFSQDEINLLKDLPEHKKKLDDYLNYINDCCPISQEPFSSKIHYVTISGVTIEQRDNAIIEVPFTKTYEKPCIREWIRVHGENANEPCIGCPLNDPSNKIEFSGGFPHRIVEFIQTTRPLLASTSHATIQTQLNVEKETPKPPVIEAKTPEAPAPHSLKKQAALLRLAYYKTKLDNPSFVTEDKELNLQPKMISAK